VRKCVAMTPRMKVSAWLAAWIVGSMALFVVAHYVNLALLLLVFVLQAVVAVMVMRVQCPYCKFPVLKRVYRAEWGRLVIWSPLVPKRCKNCDRSLNAKT
jgi:hypothetical protein